MLSESNKQVETYKSAEEAEERACDLNKWICSPEQKFNPNVIFRSPIIGDKTLMATTSRSSIYTAKLEAGETVALKIFRWQKQDKATLEVSIS